MACNNILLGEGGEEVEGDGSSGEGKARVNFLKVLMRTPPSCVAARRWPRELERGIC